MRRKLTLTVVVALIAVGAAATGQTAQASTKHSNFMKHPSYIVRGLLCIHHYEGSWTDPGSPYWGGLQMDLSFQRTYGWFGKGTHKWYFMNRWGTADNWPVWAQVVAGIHAYFSRGFEPWPVSSVSCGLR